MSLVRCLIPPLLLLLIGSAHAEQALQLTAELTAPANLAIGFADCYAGAAAAAA